MMNSWNNCLCSLGFQQCKENKDCFQRLIFFNLRKECIENGNEKESMSSLHCQHGHYSRVQLRSPGYCLDQYFLLHTDPQWAGQSQSLNTSRIPHFSDPLSVEIVHLILLPKSVFFHQIKVPRNASPFLSYQENPNFYSLRLLFKL